MDEDRLRRFNEELEARVRRDPNLQDVLNENSHGNVYRGTGEEIKRLITRYSVIIHLYFEEYENANRGRKRQIKLEIYQQVRHGGGRFLCEDRITEMAEDVALKKIGRALTDAADRARQPEMNDEPQQERDDARMEEDEAEPNRHDTEMGERQQPNGANNLVGDALAPRGAPGDLDTNITQLARKYNVASDGVSNMGTAAATGNTSNDNQQVSTLQSLQGDDKGSAHNNLQNFGGFLRDETMHEFGSDDKPSVNYKFHKFPEGIHVVEQSNLQVAEDSGSDDSVDPRFKDPDYPEFDADDDASELDATEIEAHPWYNLYDK